MFVQYGIEQGSDADFIYDIEQDKNKDLYLATEKGLVKYNGYTFESIHLDNFPERSYISEIFIDNRNNLWIGNNLGQIWTNSITGDLNEYRLVAPFNSEIVEIVEDGNNTIWICSRSNGILHIDPFRDHSEYFSSFRHHAIVNAMEVLSDGLLLVGTNEGLYIHIEENDSLRLLNRSDKIPSSKITKILRFENEYWVGTKDEGLFHLLWNDDTIEFELKDQRIETSHISIQNIARTKGGILWISTPSSGIYEIEGEQLRSFNQRDGLISEDLNSIFIDDEQNLWIGTSGKGLFRKQNSPFHPIFKSLENMHIQDLLAYKSDIYVAESEHLYVLKKSEEHKTLKPLLINQPTSLAFWETHIFIGTSTNGVLCLEEGQKTNEYSELNKIEGIKHLMVHDSRLYISTNTGGLIIFDLGSREFEQYNTQNGLTHNEVNMSFVDSKNRVWLGMSGAVLNSIDQGRILTFGKNEGLHPFDYSGIVEDSNGDIWIASDGGGIYKYDGNKFKHYQKDNGLASNYIIGLGIDEKERIWASSRNMISIFEPTSESFRTLQVKEGLHHFSVSDNGIKLWNDSVIVCSDKGVFMYNALNDIETDNDPNLRFTSILINDSLHSISERIELGHGKYSMKVGFQATCLSDQGSIKYKYFLNGQEQGFGPEFSEPTCYYPGLLQGDQELLVISTDCFGNWVTEPIKLKISIAPPFYQRPMFVLLSSLFVLVLMSGFVIYREHKNKKLNKYLSTELDKRTVEVRKQKDELAEKNQEIQDSIRYAKRIQRSMLSSVKWLEKNSSGHFIFYKPRDIVSGDFYWFTETIDHFIFAGADCTGHGVPGSLMSMICISEIDKAINLDGLCDPGDILQKVDAGVREALHQNEYSQTNDGMDIGICVLNKKQRTLLYAGAGRPCYIMDNGVLTEIKGTRDHIGGGELEKKNFEVHTIELNTKKRIYLTSDGFVDQFGGEHGKKYMRKKIRALIASVQHLSMVNQLSEIEKEFDSWKGDLEQVDDVLFLGVEL